jgi:hypothetical protein
MTSLALRIYTAAIAVICAGAVAWSLHQGSVASAWKADAGSWHALAAQAVAHDRLTTRDLRATVVRYDRLVIRTRRSQHALLAAIRKARAGAAQAILPATPSFSAAALPVAPAPVPVAPAPTTHTSPAP